jgi:tetratricopeptide (TPR) repeat protein
VGAYFYDFRFDSPRALQFYQRALKLAGVCPDSSPKCEVLINIAHLQYMTGEYCTAQVHASEAHRLSQFSANLYNEARALWIEAMCLTSLGNFKQSADQLHRSRVMLGICGLADGYMDHQIAISQGEIYLLKSEYAKARNIYNHIVETSSPVQDLLSYALSLVNIAHIATICGDTSGASHILNQAKNIFGSSIDLRDRINCLMVEADIELAEKSLR